MICICLSDILEAFVLNVIKNILKFSSNMNTFIL